ncbi:multimeric flavodoxin WrbA [Desulfosporosinus acidiphilus SJ4]|uniref:Multimeric flavodoxin WrbA n=1 Tax=Desulfosporosinus acidiphilus (strain DSM 22704 / JCM 16185 / SJ4) TaxID=646529 RepID=I4D6D2_DESAJ|nr:flavodoxin family protein [Desulfosporosinus acidiphilus]AFM41356.1 multimeric flavodoxin WrbA [Desulfosporosinus acidiphilus SJ4]
MKKILGIVASQRKLANGEILIKEAAASVGEEAELELVKLTDLKLMPCKACYACLGKDKRCPLDDDLYSLFDRIKEADGVILSSPCYALGPAGITKIFGDRIIALAQQIDQIWGKPCVIIGTAGIRCWEGYTLSAMIANARFMGLEVKDAHMFIGALPGETLVDPEGRERIKLIGQSLFGIPHQPESGQCPTCWSDLWKFPTPNHALCPICGQEAKILPADDGNSLTWEFGPSAARFSKDHLKEHFQVWLKDQVQEFIKRRKELALIRNKYRV